MPRIVAAIILMAGLLGAGGAHATSLAPGVYNLAFFAVPSGHGCIGDGNSATLMYSVTGKSTIYEQSIYKYSTSAPNTYGGGVILEVFSMPLYLAFNESGVNADTAYWEGYYTGTETKTNEIRTSDTDALVSNQATTVTNLGGFLYLKIHAQTTNSFDGDIITDLSNQSRISCSTHFTGVWTGALPTTALPPTP